MSLKKLLEGSRLWWVAGALCVLLLALMLGQTGGETLAATQEERRIAEVLSAMAGVGKVQVALYYQKTPADGFSSAASVEKPIGAVVVAEGADDWNVRLNLIRAMRTLLDLPETAVDVFAMEESR